RLLQTELPSKLRIVRLIIAIHQTQIEQIQNVQTLPRGIFRALEATIQYLQRLEDQILLTQEDCLRKLKLRIQTPIENQDLAKNALDLLLFYDANNITQEDILRVRGMPYQPLMTHQTLSLQNQNVTLLIEEIEDDLSF